MIDRNDMTVEDFHTLFGIFTHEIRTGLNAAIGFAHLIAHDERLPGTTVEDATVIKQSAQNTILVCNDYLEIFGHLIGRKGSVDEAAQPIDLATIAEECLVEPLRLVVEKQNGDQSRQQARFRTGKMDGDELEAIRYVMNLMGATIESYFTQANLETVLQMDMPSSAILICSPPTPVRQTLNNLHLLGESLGCTYRHLRITPRADEVDLVYELNIPMRNRRDCEALLLFSEELELGLDFERHFENRRMVVLDLWRRQIPAGLTLTLHPDIDAHHDQLIATLTLPIE